MMILITGGSACGKSAHAERILCEKAQKSRLYLATMQPFGTDAQARIQRHHALRAGKGFFTIERYRNLAELELPEWYDGILLEDLGNLLANELFSPEGAGQNAISNILNGIQTLQKSCNTLVMVSNEIFSDGISYDTQTLQYIRMLGMLHSEIAKRADVVAESVCGILSVHKGSLTKSKI